MNRYEEFQKLDNYDKLTFFSNLSLKEQTDLFFQLTHADQKEMLSSLSINTIKNMIATAKNDSYKEYIYRQLTSNQLETLYKISSEEDQKDMLNHLDANQQLLTDRVAELNSDIKSSTAAIKKSTTAIQNSRVAIEKAKVAIKQNKQELKQTKITLKKLDKERSKRLKKVLKASKPSVLDRVGIFSKYRTQKLMTRLEELQLTEKEIDKNTLRDENLRASIIKNKEQIEQERQNIKKNQQTIVRNEQKINNRIKRIGNLEIKIQSLDKTEKKILGKKLYNQRIATRDLVAVRKKKDVQKKAQPQQKVEPLQQADIAQKQAPIQASAPTPTSTQNPDKTQPAPASVNVNANSATDLLNSMLSLTSALQSLGVNFYPPQNVPNQPQSANLLANPIMTMDKMQAMIANYAMIAIWNQARLQYEANLRQQQEQQLLEQQQTHQRTLKPGGFVNLSLLISAILFILSLFLFFIK